MSTPPGQQNQFFGVKVSKPGINVNEATDNQLVYKNDYTAQTFFGTSGNIQFGVLDDGGLGQQIVDTNGNVLFKLEGQTWYWYDAQGNNVMQVGLLPDGTYGWSVATPGHNVADSY